MSTCSYEFDPGDVAGETTLDGVWSCPHEAHADADRCVFHLGPDRREDLGIAADEVVERLREVIAAADPEQKRVVGASLPALDFDYEELEGSNRYPLDLRHASVAALSFEHATVDLALDVRDAQVGDVVLADGEFERWIRLDRATVDGGFDAGETRFGGDLGCTGAAFTAEVTLDEADFRDRASFREATFQAPASFHGTEFHGRSNVREDNTAFDDARFAAEATFEQAVFEFASFERARFDAVASFEEATFDGDVTFEDAAFAGLADFDEGRFHEDTSFKGVAFQDVADFRGIEFSGGANVLEDDAEFEDAVFHDEARFQHSDFAFADFKGVTFHGEASFEASRFDQDATFADTTFEAFADFDEVRFFGDGDFQGVTFHGDADFRGVEFHGGDNVLEDDAEFEGAHFHAEADFYRGTFEYVDFRGVTFGSEAIFEGATFEEDADFDEATFESLADFDEARFHGNGDFRGVTFRGETDFRGVEFAGQTRHLEENARFENATFHDGGEFDDAVFSSANFRDVTVGATMDFRHVTFRDRLAMTAISLDETVYVDMSDATIPEGQISQPDDHWVRYDMTQATLGDLTLSGDDGTHQLFHYFRFIETNFDGFDFAAHRTYLERNDWRLHDFDEAEADYEYAVESTPGAIETTYLYAYNCATAQGHGEAAIEFAIRQALFRRKKNVGYARDRSMPLSSRVGKATDVAGNYLWHLVCGYGYRLWRIILSSAVVIVLWGIMYAMPFTELDNQASLSSAGAVFSLDGLATVGTYIYYSLITFTTVGYGDINPVNTAARFLAVTEGILGILLAALVVFVLGRRVAL